MADRNLIPICSWCKKIRTDTETWENIEIYLTKAGFGVFTHGICPHCAERIFEKRVYLESYQNICKAISSSLTLNEVLELVVTNVVRVMNVKASMLRLLNEETRELEIAAHYGLSERYINKGPVSLDASIEDALKGKSVSVYDITLDENSVYRQVAVDEGIRSILSIPLKVKGKVTGVLRMYTSEPMQYTEEDLKFVTAIADQAAVAINNARIYESSITREKEYLRVFEDVTKAVSSTLNFDEVLRMIVKKLPEIMGLKATTIRLIDGESGSLRLVAAYGLSRGYLNRGPVDGEVNVKEALQMRPVSIFDVSRDERIIYKREMTEEGIKSMLTLPILSKGKLLGILRLLTGVPRRFSSQEVDFAQSLAEVCGIAIDNARMYEALARETQK